MLYLASSCCLRKYNKIKLIAFDIIRLHLKNSVRRYRCFFVAVVKGGLWARVWYCKFDFQYFNILQHFYIINCEVLWNLKTFQKLLINNVQTTYETENFFCLSVSLLLNVYWVNLEVNTSRKCLYEKKVYENAKRKDLFKDK